ncbi:MAG: zinc ribbon domain-containing protein [Deltaproteobacteria bacterium]|nr:zinc ribbon domain-containing protein [Deltaproteobacteria bacterium]
MPIYEYHCGKCGDFEVMQKMSDKPLAECPTCRRKVTKLISSTSFQLKGSGWYVTDYARKGSSGCGESKGSSGGAGKSEEKGTKSEDKKSDATTSESKPESKSKKGGSEKAAAA